MSKIIKHPGKSCVGITIDWTVCLCLFISGQSDTETCTRNSPSRGRQYNQNNMSRNFLSFLSFSLSTPRTSNFKTKSNFLTSFVFYLRVSLYLPTTLTFCWFNHCCSGLTNYHYKKPVFVTECLLLPLWKQKLTVFAELVSRVSAHLPTDSLVVYMFFPFQCWHETHTQQPQNVCAVYAMEDETRLGYNMPRLLSPLPFSPVESFNFCKNSRNKSLFPESLSPKLPPL